MVNPERKPFKWGNNLTPESLLDSSDQINLDNEMTPDQTQLLQNNQVNDEDSKPKFQWGNNLTPDTYQGEPNPRESESFFETSLRNIIANSFRVGEKYLGRYGDLEQFSKTLLTNMPESGGLLGYATSELIGKDNWDKLINGLPGMEQQFFPTSEQLKDVTKGITGKYTEPKVKGEKIAQEYFEDIGSLIGKRPGRTLKQQATEILGIPAAANISKNIIKETGFSENQAELAKIATWLPLLLANRVNGKTFAADLTNAGRNAIPQHAQFNVQRLQQSLQNLGRQFLAADDRTKLAREKIDAIIKDIGNGQINLRSLLQTYDGINASKRSKDMFSLTRDDQKFATHAINKVRDAVRDEIRTSGASYPDAIKQWEQGIKAWATIHTSNQVANIVDRWANGPYAKILAGPALALFGATGYAATKFPAFATAGAAAIPAAYQTGKVFYRMYDNPQLRKYYFNAIEAASKDNAQQFISNFNKLNKGLEKENKKQRKKTELSPII